MTQHGPGEVQRGDIEGSEMWEKSREDNCVTEEAT
jgi:hypothetical protein